MRRLFPATPPRSAPGLSLAALAPMVDLLTILIVVVLRTYSSDPPLQIEGERSTLDGINSLRGLGEQALPAQQDLHAGQQLAQGKGLAEVVVGTDLEAEHAVELLVLRRQEEDGQALGACPQVSTKRQTIHPRHQDVGHHQVR